jgi:hypothetical protein
MDSTRPENPIADEAECRIDDGHVVFAEGCFKIPLDRCKTHRSIVEWTLHLSRQTWATRGLLRRFAELAIAHHKLEADRF